MVTVSVIRRQQSDIVEDYEETYNVIDTSQEALDELEHLIKHDLIHPLTRRCIARVYGEKRMNTLTHYLDYDDEDEG